MIKVILTLFALIAVASAIRGSRSNPVQFRFDENEGDAGNFCQGCKSIVSFASQFNSSTKYSTLIEPFCQLYYPPSTDYQQGPCKLFAGMVFYLLNHIDPVHHCDQIGACDNFSPFERFNMKFYGVEKRTRNGICEICQQAIEQFKTWIEDPKLIDDLKSQIKAFCDYLKVVGQDQQCNQLLNNYFDQAIEFIRNLDPQSYCSAIKFCVNDNSIESKQSSPMSLFEILRQLPKPFLPMPAHVSMSVPSLSEVLAIGPQLTVKIGNQYSTNNLMIANDDDDDDDREAASLRGPFCQLCQVVVEEALKLIDANTTVENIEKGLSQVCKLVFRHGEKYEQCEEMVEAYTKELVELLSDETDPKVICMLLDQCTYIKPTANIKRPQAPKVALDSEFVNFINMLGGQIDAESQIKSMDSFKTCFECKIFIKYIRDTLKDKKSRDEARDWLLNNLCDNLEEQSLKNSCVSMVNQYSDAFFQAISQQLDPQTVCSDLKACKSKKNPLYFDFKTLERPDLSKLNDDIKDLESKLIVQKKKQDGQLCDQCIEIVTKIDEYLSSHPIEDDVQVLIDQVCNKLPRDSALECTILVKTFGQDIAKAIASMDNPRDLCTKAYLC